MQASKLARVVSIFKLSATPAQDAPAARPKGAARNAVSASSSASIAFTQPLDLQDALGT
jgi:hypothetical protein